MIKKSILILSMAAFSLGVSAKTTNVITENVLLQGDEKTETFKVFGNCGMCESTMEGSLKGEKGIKESDWNKETKIMTVTFDSEKITLDEIKKKIADVGYDTAKFRASEKTYNKLPGCCQYERPESK